MLVVLEWILSGRSEFNVIIINHEHPLRQVDSELESGPSPSKIEMPHAAKDAPMLQASHFSHTQRQEKDPTQGDVIGYKSSYDYVLSSPPSNFFSCFHMCTWRILPHRNATFPTLKKIFSYRMYVEKSSCCWFDRLTRFVYLSNQYEFRKPPRRVFGAKNGSVTPGEFWYRRSVPGMFRMWLQSLQVGESNGSNDRKNRSQVGGPLDTLAFRSVWGVNIYLYLFISAEL